MRGTFLGELFAHQSVYMIRCIHRKRTADFYEGVYVITLRKYKPKSLPERAQEAFDHILKVAEQASRIYEDGYALVAEAPGERIRLYVEAYKNAMYRIYLRKGIVQIDLLYRTGLERVLREAVYNELKNYSYSRPSSILNQAKAMTEDPQMMAQYPDILERTIACIKKTNPKKKDQL